MTTFRLAFSGEIKKAEHRNAGGKPLVEVSICKKNHTKQDEEPSFTWAKINLWQPAEFQTAKLVKGAFIAGTGELTLRSYVNKDGVKATAMEVRCTSFDVEVADGSANTTTTAPAARPVKAPAKAAAADYDDNEAPPF